MKKMMLIAFLAIILAGCKNKEARIYDFVENFNDVKSQISDTLIIDKKAFYKGAKEGLSLDYIFKVAPDSLDNSTLFVRTYQDLDKVFETYPEGKKLLDEQVKMTVRVFDKFGTKIAEEQLTNDKL